MSVFSVGTEFGLTFALMVVGGWWLDQRLGHQFPILALLGAAAGFGLGMVRLVRRARRMQEKGKDEPSDDGCRR